MELKKCRKCRKPKRIDEFRDSFNDIPCRACFRARNGPAQNIRQRRRRAEDPGFRLRANVSGAIRLGLKRAHSSKAGRSVIEFLPYTFDELRRHLEAQFEPWMSWENYGVASTNLRTWQIDHIIPQAALPYTSMNDENFRKCWALENLRPLDAIANIKKGTGEHVIVSPEKSENVRSNQGPARKLSASTVEFIQSYSRKR